MKQRRYIAWFLILVSIIMLTASVLPHHHHREILCLQHDITVCGCQCSGEQHNHDVSHDKHTCNAGCVTKFKTITPEKVQNSVSPDYSFCSLLYTVPDILLLSLRLTERNTIPDTYYLEKLHSTCLPLSSFHGVGNFLSDERYGQSGEVRTACRDTLLIPHTKSPAY